MKLFKVNANVNVATFGCYREDPESHGEIMKRNGCFRAFPPLPDETLFYDGNCPNSKNTHNAFGVYGRGRVVKARSAGNAEASFCPFGEVVWFKGS